MIIYVHYSTGVQVQSDLPDSMQDSTPDIKNIFQRKSFPYPIVTKRTRILKNILLPTPSLSNSTSFFRRLQKQR